MTKATQTTATPVKDCAVELTDARLDAATGGAAHELAHVVQQTQTAQFNPKELTIDKSVPWQR